MNISRRFRKGISALMAATVFCVTTMGNITPADPIIVARSSASNAAKASRANARKASASEALPLDEDGLLMDGVLINDLEIQADEKQDRPVLTASLVDEFGNSIDDRYNQIPVKVDGELLPLDDPDTPPVKDVYVKTGFFGLKKRSYHFVEATADGSIITAIRLQEKDGEDEEQSASAAETQTVATGSNAQKRAAKTRQKSWFYTENGLDWTEITEDTELLFVYAPENRTVFEYEDEDVVVTAVTEKEDALPAGAELVVKPVTRQSTDYHYDAYLAALNQAAEENRDSDDYLNRYEENNTLLYDIAFLVRSEDGAEAADAGAAESFVEYQPEEGAVKVSFTFKKNQLKNDLGAKAPEQVKVHHIPLKDNTDDAAVRTDSAANVQAEDLAPETLKASFREVSGQEQMEFTTESFSVYAFAYTVDFFYNLNGNIYRYTLPGGGEVLLSELVEKLGIRGDANQEGRREGYTAFENTASFMNEIGDVRFSNGSLVQVTRKGADWSLKSLVPFNTEEALTITMKNGDVLKVKVTDDQEPFTIRLYGFQFGAFYKRWSATSTSASYKMNMIGYPEMLLGDNSIKEKLTVKGVSGLKEKPFTFGTEGFDLEDVGLVPTEENKYSMWHYDVIGFVPVADADIKGLKNTEAYNETYVFDTEEEAESFVKAHSGVLYGEQLTDEGIAALQEKESMAMVWRRRDHAGFNSLNFSVNPTKLALGDNKDVLFKIGFSGLQKGDYSEKPIQAALTLSEGMTFCSDQKFSAESTQYFRVDPDSVQISEDGKTLSFRILEILQNSSSSRDVPVRAAVNIADRNQTSESVVPSAVNAWGKTVTRYAATITLNRPTVRTTLDKKSEKVLFFGEKGQQVQLAVEHGNAVSGKTETHVEVVLPKQVTLEDALFSSKNKNTVSGITIAKNEDGASMLSYDVSVFKASYGTSTEYIDLVLDVKDKEGEKEEKGETECQTTVGGEKALVTENAAIKVAEKYFEVRLYGPQDAWMDMSRGDGRVNSSFRTLRFYGESDYRALMQHKWSFEEEPLKEHLQYEKSGECMVGPRVKNLYTNETWDLVGFIPIHYWSGDIRGPWDQLYGEYYLENLDDCKALIEKEKGVLYGQAPTEEQAKSLAKEWTGTYAKVICVWYVHGAPKTKDAYPKYTYSKDEETVPQIHPAAFSETSSGIQVEIESPDQNSGEAHPYVVTFTIPADYDEDTITLNTEFNNAEKPIVKGFQPGDKLNYQIRVIDRSGKYGYLRGSGAVGTIDYYKNDRLSCSVIGEGFEGYRIENADEKTDEKKLSRIPRRGSSQAIQILATISGFNMSQNPSDFNVGKALYEIGYGRANSGDTDHTSSPNGVSPRRTLARRAPAAPENEEPDYEAITREYLDDYYLDFLNGVYYAEDEHKEENRDQPQYTNFREMSADEYRSLFNGDTGTQYMETNPVVAGAMYYGMYEETILSGTQKDGIENYHGAYYWMQDFNESTEGNRYENIIYNQFEDSAALQEDGSVHHDLNWYQWVTGARNGNLLQDTYFGLAYQFKLVKKPITVRKRWYDSDGKEITESGSSDIPKQVHYLLFRRQDESPEIETGSTEEKEKTETAPQIGMYRPINASGEFLKPEELAGNVQTLTRETTETNDDGKVVPWAHTIYCLHGMPSDYYAIECSKDGTKVFKDSSVADQVQLLKNQAWVTPDLYQSSPEEKSAFQNGALVTLENQFKKVIVHKVWDDHGATGVQHPDVTITLTAAEQDVSESAKATEETAKAETAGTENAKAETAKAESGAAESAKAETAETETVKAETAAAEPAGDKSAEAAAETAGESGDNSLQQPGSKVIQSGMESVEWDNLIGWNYDTLNRIKYTASEGDVPGYRLISISESSEYGIIKNITFTNERTQKSFTVEKFWMQHSESISSTIKNASATVQLCVGTNPDHSDAKPIDGKTVTLPIKGSEKPWTYTWENLDRYDDSGKELYYSARETAASLNGKEFALGTEIEPYTSTTIDGTFQIYNPLPTTGIKVEKHWMQETKDGKWEDISDSVQNSSVTLALKAYEKDSDGGYGKEVKLSENWPVILRKAPWTYTWDNLDVYGENGKELVYTVEEESAILDGRVINLDAEDRKPVITEKDGVVRIENPIPKEKEPEQKPKTSVTVEKRWLRDGVNITSDVKNASSTMQLVRDNGSGKEKTLVGEIILPVSTGETPWSYTWKDLPQYDDAGGELTYQVVETAAAYGGRTLALDPDYEQQGTTVLVSNTIPTSPDRPSHHSSSGNPPKVTKQNRPKPEGSVLGVTREPEPVLPVPQVLGVGRLPRTGENSEAKSLAGVLAVGSAAMILLLLCGAWVIGRKRREE